MEGMYRFERALLAIPIMGLYEIHIGLYERYLKHYPTTPPSGDRFRGAFSPSFDPPNGWKSTPPIRTHSQFKYLDAF
jgi:hypothetical protein